MRHLILSSLLLIQISSFAQKGSGKTLDFNGTSNYVEIPNNAALNPGAAFTVEAWINADTWAASSWQGSIVSKDMWSSISEGWIIRCGANGTLSFNLALNNNNFWYEVLSAPLMQLNKWYHVAGTYDGTTLRLYLNGKEVGTLTQAGTITATTAPVKFGNMAMAAQSRYFDGKIDEVRLWKVAVSEANLRQYMCKKLDASHPNYNNLIAYYNFNSGTTSAIYDSGPSNLHGTIFGAVRTVSGAPIGDKSAFLYPTSWTGQQLKYGHANGDSLRVASVTGSPIGLHIYYVDSLPNYSTPPAGVASFYPSRFYGVYPTSGTSVTFTETLFYNGYPGITNQGKLNLSHRTDNADSTWAGITVVLDSTAKTMVRTAAVQGEYALGRNDEMYPFMLNSPASNSIITLQGAVNQTAPFNWFKAKTQGGAQSDYRWLLDFDTANFSTPLGSKLSTTAGKDTTASINYSEMAGYMNLAGLTYGDTLRGKWTVRATAGPIQKLATTPFNVFIVRDIISSDRIYAFTVLQPDGDTIEVIEKGSATTIFNWTRPTTTVGKDINYEVEITGFSGMLSTPLGTFQADLNGKDSIATISDSAMTVMLQTIGMPANNTFQFKWRTKAYVGSLNGYSSDSNYVYIRWIKDPFEGINGSEQLSKVKVYPNPASDVIYIDNLPEDANFQLQMVDSRGLVVYEAGSKTGSANSIALPVNLSEGLYLLMIRIGDETRCERIVIE